MTRKPGEWHKPQAVSINITQPLWPIRYIQKPSLVVFESCSAGTSMWMPKCVSWVLVSPSAWFEGWSIPTPGLKEIPAISLVHLDSEDARIPRKYQCNPIVSLVLDTKGCYKQQHVIHGIQWDPIVEEKNTYLQFMWWIRIQSMSKRQWISVKSWALFLSMAFHGFIIMFPNLWMFHTLGVNPLRQTHRTVINRNSMRATSRSSRLCFSEVWNPPCSLCLKP